MTAFWGLAYIRAQADASAQMLHVPEDVRYDYVAPLIARCIKAIRRPLIAPYALTNLAGAMGTRCPS
jgi:hypothetical protein